MRGFRRLAIRLLFPILLLLAAAGVAFAAGGEGQASKDSGSAVPGASGEKYLPGQVLVEFREGAGAGTGRASPISTTTTPGTWDLTGTARSTHSP